MVEVMLLAVVFVVGLGSVVVAGLILGMRMLKKPGQRAED
jgi:hypothetical protein